MDAGRPSAPRARRGSRTGRRGAAAEPLSNERILDAALEVIGETGLAGFSMRRLGERVGREAMTLYHHFPSKQHLLDALVDRAIGSVEVPEPGPDGPARLRRVLASYRAMARRWPALFPLVAVHRLNTPAGVRYIESILRLIRSVDPDPEHAARTFRLMGYYLVGACLDETAGYARGPSAAEPVSDALIANECPLLAQSAPYFQQRHWNRTFELGVDLLMDALGRRVPAPAAPARRAGAASKRRRTGP